MPYGRLDMMREDHADEQAGSVPAHGPRCSCQSVPDIWKRCPSCGAEYDPAAWWRLACIGQMIDDAGSLCLHNCTCGNTLAVEVR